MRILFITSTRVGDAILSTGLLDHLITKHPGARITVACGSAATGLFAAVPNLEQLIVLDKMVLSCHWLMLWARCAAKIWDLVVDLRNAPITYLLPARIRRRMGRVRAPVHRVRQLARVLDLADSPPSPRLWITDRHRRIAEEFIPDGPPVLAVGPTANWRAKTWRAECFAELIERLSAPDGIVPGARVAILGRDDERPMVLALIDAVPAGRRIDLVGRLDLLEAFACLRRCAFYVGNDSGLMHLTAATGIPTLGLFGPSLEVHYAPWGSLCGVVRTSIDFENIFPEDFNHRDTGTLMDSLTVDMAEKAARELWDRALHAAA
ncbi:MAG TPA: glycosyltransferase family 9 protein [Rhodospirillales bacterium]|jgi:ADP-heptose:LPS heptosyltransferase|nr:glycosyltransferase family 9 protein [Rhodospirillales bacterium]